MSDEATHSQSQSDRRLVATVAATDAQGRQRSADEIHEETVAMAQDQQAGEEKPG